MVIFSPTVQSLGNGNFWGLLCYRKSMGRNYVGDFISDYFQSLSFKDRLQIHMCNERQSEAEGNQLGH